MEDKTLKCTVIDKKTDSSSSVLEEYGVYSSIPGPIEKIDSVTALYDSSLFGGYFIRDVAGNVYSIITSDETIQQIASKTSTGSVCYVHDFVSTEIQRIINCLHNASPEKIEEIISHFRRINNESEGTKNKKGIYSDIIKVLEGIRGKARLKSDEIVSPLKKYAVLRELHLQCADIDCSHKQDPPNTKSKRPYDCNYGPSGGRKDYYN